MKTIDAGLPVLCTGFVILLLIGLTPVHFFYISYAGIGIAITLALILCREK